MGLEDILYGSQEIRNFLKLFSETHWDRVCKATLSVGITRLEELMDRVGENGLTNLSVDAIEELAVASSKKLRRKKQAVKEREVASPPKRDENQRQVRHAAKPSSQWRRGDSRSPSKGSPERPPMKNPQVYPDWWCDP